MIPLYNDRGYFVEMPYWSISTPIIFLIDQLLNHYLPIFF
jgi:hypothetical protein